MDGKIKDLLGLLFILLFPFGIILGLFELAVYINLPSVYIAFSGLAALVALGAMEIFERSK